MDRIATCSIIRGNGGVEAYVNGVVSEELRRQNAIRAAEEEALKAELATTKARRNRLLAEDLKLRHTKRKIPLRERVRDRIADGWAWVMGCIITYAECMRSRKHY